MRHTNPAENDISIRSEEDAEVLGGVVSNTRRSLVVEELEGVTGPLDEARLARRVASRETDRSSPTVSEDRVHEVHVALHHNHLPRLADVGFIRFDRSAGVVEDIQVPPETPLIGA